MKSAFAQSDSAAITGSWQIKEADNEQVLIFQDGFFFHTAYNKGEKRFIYSRGGTYTHNADALNCKISFNSVNKKRSGSSSAQSIQLPIIRLINSSMGKHKIGSD